MPWRNENKYDTYIKRAVHDFPDVPTYIVKAVIAHESGFNEKAHRDEPQIADSSRGLMQLLLKTARAVGYGGTPDGLYSPGVNIYYGTKLLSQNFARTGNWPDALSAYNGGFRPTLAFGSVARRAGIKCMGRVVPIGEYCNQQYVDTVLRYAAYFASREGIAVSALPFRGSQGNSGTERGNAGNGVGGSPSVLRGVKGWLIKVAIKHYLGGRMFGKGWKAKAGAVLAAVGAVLGALTELGVALPGVVADTWTQIVAIGAALGIYGIRDKQERDAPRQ